jgi:hypothetical protein
LIQSPLSLSGRLLEIGLRPGQMDASDLFPWLERRLLADLRAEVAGPVLAYLNGGPVEDLRASLTALTNPAPTTETPIGRSGVPVETLTGTKAERDAAARARIEGLRGRPGGGPVS